MSNGRDHKAFTDALEQFATQYGYKVSNVGLYRHPMEFIGGPATASLNRLNDSPVFLEVSFRDMKGSEEAIITPEKTELPEWCRDGELGWENGDYFRLEVIDANHPVTMKYLDDGVEESVIAGYIAEHVKQARLRPYNADEMKALVGKVVENGVRAMLVLSYRKDLNKILTDDRSLYAEQILTDCTIDGSPCGVLEHLNDKGEWVE